MTHDLLWKKITKLFIFNFCICFRLLASRMDSPQRAKKRRFDASFTIGSCEPQVFPFCVGNEFTPLIAKKIFSKLDKIHLVKVRRVCQTWKSFVDNQTDLWKNFTSLEYQKAAGEGRLDICRLIISKAEDKNPKCTVKHSWFGMGQVWSLTQFYSDGFLLRLRISIKKCRFFYKHTITVWGSCL